MSFDLRPALAAVRSKISPALASLRAHRFWVECAFVTFLVLLAGTLVGGRAQARAEGVEREVVRLEQVRAGVDRWLREITPPAAPESLAWRESEQMLEILGGDGVSALSVSHLLAQRAEEIGIRSVRIRLANADSFSIPPATQVGRWELRAGEAAMVAEFVGDWSSVISFLGVLPPQVEVGDVQITARGGLLHTRLLLHTRRVALQEGS